MRILLWAALIILSSCIGKNKDTDNILARVNDKYLYQSELKDLVPEGTSVKDSIALAKNYINNWIRDRLVLDKAEKNLLDEDKHFDKQLEEYRNSLVVYKYETNLIAQTLDTAVSDTDIEDYYNHNIGNFQLKDNIVKVYYVRFLTEDNHLKKFRRYFYSDESEARDSVESYAERYSDLYFLNNETWVLFADVLKYVPIKTYNQEAYLQNHRKIEITEEPYTYFVSFSDFKIKNGVSPLSFEKENIRQIILNQRKLKIIKDMREEVFQTALKDDDFEIY